MRKNIFVTLLTGILLLSCNIVNASEYVSYFKISKDFASNPVKARKTWLKKNITVEGTVLLSGTNDKNNQVIVLLAESPSMPFDFVGYAFIFDGAPNEASWITKGQRVIMSGKVNDIEKSVMDEKNVLTIDLEHSRIIQVKVDEEKFIPFFWIPNELQNIREKYYNETIEQWIGERICIEGKVDKIDTQNNKVSVILSGKNPIPSAFEETTYKFSFNGNYDDVKEIEKGETVRISGRIDNILIGNQFVYVYLTDSIMLF